MVGLVVEGGAFKCAFTSGVLDAFLDFDININYCIGVSGGALHLMSYISKQKLRAYTSLLVGRYNKNYISYKNFFTSKALFGLEHVFNEIPNELYKFDYENFGRYGGRFIVPVTLATTGNSYFFNGLDYIKKGERWDLIQATCSIPLYFPVKKIDDYLCFDGGIASPIPIEKALSDGCDKFIIIRTGTNEKTSRSISELIGGNIISRKYPALKKVILNRHQILNRNLKVIRKLEETKRAIVFKPSGTYKLKTFESKIVNLQKAYYDGYQQAYEKISLVKKFIKEQSITCSKTFL